MKDITKNMSAFSINNSLGRKQIEYKEVKNKTITPQKNFRQIDTIDFPERIKAPEARSLIIAVIEEMTNRTIMVQ